MNSYHTKLIKWDQINKSNGMEGNKWNESNQIKSNTRNDYTTWVWLLWISYEIISILFINNTLFWFRLNILLNESSSLTFWNRFGLSNYNPYSLFWSTYQCHQNKDHRNSILQNWLDAWLGRSAFNHFEPFHYYFALSTSMNHHPIILPYSAVSDITIHTFLADDSFYYHSNIHKRMDHWLTIGIVWFFAFIDSISFVDKEYGYRLW